LYVFYYTYNLYCDLNFLNVIKYKNTNPKLNTSDLNGFDDTIFLLFIFISYGAKNGTVPNIVAYYIFYPVTTLQLPTSHNLI
jgi:hypothetical protein